MHRYYLQPSDILVLLLVDLQREVGLVSCLQALGLQGFELLLKRTAVTIRTLAMSALGFEVFLKLLYVTLEVANLLFQLADSCGVIVGPVAGVF